MSQTIQKDQVVGILYSLKDASGQILDESLEEPLEYLHGHKNIIDGLEKALEGLTVGDKKEVEVAPEQGYGAYNESLLLTFSKDTFPPDLTLEVGIELEAQSDQGIAILRVKEIRENEVVMDGNHPLAGEKLFFSIEVKNLRSATEEELAHGHVHGPHGHHH